MPRALPNGASQGPFQFQVPADPTLAHRLTVRLTSRCAPRWFVEVKAGGARVSIQTLGDDSQWRQVLREHF